MRVQELKLHNFRGIKDLHLVFNTEHNVVVLAGINGVGKSSILDSINLLFRYYEMIAFSSLFERRSIRNTSFQNIIPGSDIKNNEKDAFVEISACIEETIVEWVIFNTGEIKESSIEKIVKSPKMNIGKFYFYYLSSRQFVRLARAELKLENIVTFDNFSEWFRSTEDLENEIRLSGDIHYRYPTLETVRTATYRLLGNNYVNLRFKRDLGKLTITKLSQEIAVDSLSDGEKSLIAMVGHLSRRLAENSEQYTNPLEASAIVLIDEIELHLHPAWQRSIIPRLTQTFPNCQFIVTTHSPQVLSHVDPECIHVLDYDEDNNVIVKRPDSSYGLDSNRILEDILEVPKRPQEIQARMSELFVKINNNELEEAKKIVKELADAMKTNDEPELIKAEATIRRRETIGR